MPKLNVVLSWLALGLTLPAAALAQTSAAVTEGTDSVGGNALPVAETSAEPAPYPMSTSPILEGYTPPAVNSGYYDNHGLPVPAGSVPPTVSDIVNRVNMDVSGTMEMVPAGMIAPTPMVSGAVPMPMQMPVPMPMQMAAPVQSASPDVNFIHAMMAHHQAAIFMAKQVIATGTDPYVKMLANDIISAQDREIEWMKDWLAAYGPKDANAAPAKAVGTPPNHGVNATLPPIPAKETKKKPEAKKAPAKKPAPKKVVKPEAPAAEAPAAQPAAEATPVAPAKEPAKPAAPATPAKAATPAATVTPAAELPAADAAGGNSGAEEEDMPTMPNAFGK